MGCLDNINKQYIITLFQSLIPAYAIERLFWQERGMNVQMVVYCEIIYAFTVFLLEVPSGILADRYGRKTMLVLNGVLSAAEMAILLYANSFFAFGLAVLLSGIGKAFSSGSQNALLYDSLLMKQKQGTFEKLLGRLSVVDIIGSVAAAVSGSVLAHFWGFELNYMLSFASWVIVVFVSLSLKEPPMVMKPEHELTGFLPYARQAMHFFKSKPVVILYCLSSSLLGACMVYLDEFMQLILDEAGVPVLFFGVVLSFTLLLQIPGNLIAYKLTSHFSYRTILLVIIAVNAAGYLAVYLTRNALCIIPMAMMALAGGVTEPLVMGYLHHQANSEIRATVESFFSLVLRGMSMGVGLLFGYISTQFSIFTGFAVPAVLCAGYLFFFAIASASRKGKEAEQ